MQVSILITNFNYARFLAQAIDSALAQTYRPLDVVVVDDGSSDGSREIIERYGTRITAVFKRNGGQSESVNVGFAYCRGDVVMLLDADDVLFPEAAALHVERLSKPGVVRSNGYLLVANQHMQPSGATIPKLLAESGDYREHAVKLGIEAYRPSFTSGCAWTHAFLQQILPLPTDPTVGADGYLTAADLFFGRVESIHQPVGLYRVHGANKGPYEKAQDVAYLQKVVSRYMRRREFAIGAAARAGYRVDESDWDRTMGWRRMMTCRALQLAGVQAPDISLRMLAMSPFASRSRNWLVGAALSLASVLTFVLPRKAGFALASKLLYRSFNRKHQRIDSVGSVVRRSQIPGPKTAP